MTTVKLSPSDIVDAVFNGDNLDVLRTFPDESVHCVVTSPPYYALRDYGVSEQIGMEDTVEEYVARLVAVFSEIKRVLRDDGTVWLNLGDTYSSGGRGSGPESSKQRSNKGSVMGKALDSRNTPGFKPKNLLLVPHRVAIALQDDGWFVRSDIVWHKRNPMPESVTDRPSKAHEYVFLLSKSPSYYYDADAVKEPVASSTIGRGVVTFGGEKGRNYNPDKSDPNYRNGHEQWGRQYDYSKSSASGRNRRSVWSIATKPYKGAHFAVMPLELADICVKAGCPEGGIVLDPFGGSGTVAVSAIMNQCRYALIELNAEYLPLIEQRIQEARNDDPLQDTVYADGSVQLSLFGDS